MQPIEHRSDEQLEGAAATLRFSITASPTAGGELRARLSLQNADMGVTPFPGIRVDALDLEYGPVTSAEIAAGPGVFKSRRCDLRKLRFSMDESALETLIARRLLPDSGIEAVSVRVLDDHLRVYLELANGKGDVRTRAVLCASADVDEAGNFILSFYDIRVFGRLPGGAVPSSLLERLLPEEGARWARREGATRVVIRPHAALLTAWLGSAGWKVPEVSRAFDRHLSLRGDRVYFIVSQTATPGLVGESTSVRNLAAFEYAEAERLFESAEEKLKEGDLESALAAFRAHAEPETGHPFALRRLMWVLAARALDTPPDFAAAAEARRLAEGLLRRVPDDVVALETLASLSLLESDRGPAAEAFEVLAARCADENDLRGRVFAELFLGELYAEPGNGQDLNAARASYETALALDATCEAARKAIAEIYAKLGDPKKAIEAWNEVLALVDDPTERRRLLLRIADAHLNGLGDADSAIRVYRQAQEGDDPDSPTVAAWEGLAKSYAAKGDAPAAIRQLERVAERCAVLGDRRGAARANYAIGELWAGPLKRPESALLRFEKTLELDPDHVGALNRKFRLFVERRALPQAVLAGHRLAEALVTASGETDGVPLVDGKSARLGAVEVLLEVATLAAEDLRDTRAAAVASGRALEIDPSHPGALAAAERFFGDVGDAKGLVMLFARVVSNAAPAAAFELRLRRGKLLAERQNDAAGAAEEYAAAAASAPDAARLEQARMCLAEALNALGRFPELRDLRAAQWKGMPAGAARAQFAVECGLLSRKLDDPAAAQDWLERAVEEDHTRSDAFAALAELAQERGDIAGYVAALARRIAAETDPSVRAALRAQAGALYLANLEDPPSALREAEAAIGEEGAAASADGGATVVAPDEAWKVLGRAKLALGDSDGAVEALETWFRRTEAHLAAASSFPAATRAAMAGEIADVHARRNDPEAELRWLRVRLESDPIDASGTQRAAILARQTGPKELAAELIEAEARLCSDRPTAASLLLEAGRLREECGDNGKAEADYVAAAQAVPQDELPLEALADLLLGQGKNEEAVDVWRRAAELQQGALAAARWRRAATLAATRLSDAEAAGRAWLRVLAIEKTDRQALAFLADRARAAGDWAKSYGLYEKLAEVSEDASPAELAQLAMRRAEAAERAAEPKAAEERWRLAASLDSALREPWKALKRLFLQQSRFEDAMEAAENEAAHAPDVTERATLLAEAGHIALERLNDPRRAAVRMREALDLVPGNMPVLDALEGVLGPLEDWTGLIQVLREKARLLRDPRRKADLLRRSAEVAWERLGNVDVATEDALAARAASGDDPKPLLFLEKMFRAERKWDRLAPLLEDRARMIEAADDETRAEKEKLLAEAAEIRAEQLGELDRAATDLERAVVDGYLGQEILALLADVQERRGDHERVATALARLAPQLEGAEKAQALLRLARVQGDQLGDLPTSIKWLAEAHQVSPDDREIALEYRGRLAKSNRWAELATVESGIAERAADPKEKSTAWRRAALVFRDRVDDEAAAVRAFKRAVEADPDDADSLHAADMLLIARGDHATRAELYRRRLDARPDDVVAREGLLSALAAAGSWTELERELKPLADQEPVHGPSVKRLLLAYRSAARWKDLMRFLEERVSSGEIAARELLEAVFAEREDWKGLAEFHLRQAEGKGGRERARGIAAAAAVLRERVHDLDRARRVLRDAAAERPDDVELFEATAEAFESAGDMEGLRDLLVDGAAHQEGRPKVALLERAAKITRERLGDAARALALYREALSIDPDDEVAGEAAVEILGTRFDWNGVVQLWTDRAERSREAKKRALYYRQAGLVSKARLGDPYRAATCYRSALVMDPDDAEAAAGAEEALEACEKWDELASFRAARAARAGTPAERTRSLIAAAVVARDKLQDGAQALDLFKRASVESPTDPVPVDAAAQILGGLGQWRELADWLLTASEGLLPADAATRRASAAEILLDGFPDDPATIPGVVEALSRGLGVESERDAALALSSGVHLLESRAQWTAVIDLYRMAMEAPALALRKSWVLSSMATVTRDRLGDPQDAADLFRRALEIDPGNGDAFGALEHWYRQTSDWDSLIAIYEADAAFATEASLKAGRYVAMADVRIGELNDAAGASADLKRALEATPNDAALAVRYEQTLEQAGKWEELASALLSRSARTSAPAAAAGLVIRAADLFAEKLGDAPKAEQLFESARANAAHPDEPLVGLERVHRKTRSFEKLVKVLEARAAVPGDGKARARLLLEAGALSLAQLKDADRALKLYEQGMKLDATSVEILREMREIFRTRSQWLAVDETIESEEQLLQSTGEDVFRAALAFERGLLYRDAFKDMTRAAFHLARAVKLDPKSFAAVRALAEVSEGIGAHGVARKEWVKLAQRAEGAEKVALLEHAAACAQAENDLEGVIFHREDAVEADPEKLDSWDKLADAYLAVTRWDEAKIVLSELLTRTSKAGDAARTITIYYRLGRAERLTNQVERAIQRLRRLLSADPDHAGALTLLAEIHREREEWKELAQVLPRLAKLSQPPAQVEVLRELGTVLEHRLGRTAEAMEAFAQALRAQPDDYESLWRLSDLAWNAGRNDVFLAAWARLAPRETAPARKLALAFRAAEALRKTGRPKEAAREYEKALEVDPQHLPSWSALAGLLEEGRDWPRAVAAYDGALRALGADAKEKAIPILVRRGMLRADKIGDYENAANDLKKAVELTPNDLALRFRFAGVLARAKGRTADAIAELKRVLERDPFRPEVYRALGEIHAGSQSLDRAFAAFSALYLVDPADVAARSFLDSNRSKIDQGMLKALDEQIRGQLLVHPDVRGTLHAGLLALSDAIAGLFPAAIDRTGLIAIDLASGSPLARMIDSIRVRLGLSALTLFVRPAALPSQRDSLADLVVVDLGENPALIVDDTLAAAIPDRRGALFLLGKYLERLKGGHAPWMRPSQEDVDHLAHAIHKAFDPNAGSLEVPGVPTEKLMAWVKALRKAAPRRFRKELEELGFSITPEKLHLWIDGMRHTENRAGLLVANDLTQGVKVVLALDPELGKTDVDAVPDRLAHLKKSSEIAEMLRFINSDEFFSLRKALGLTLDATKR